MLKAIFDKNTSANEEASFMNDATLTANIWIDSKYIPEDISTVELEDGCYKVTENQTELKIVQRCDNIELRKIQGARSSYYNALLKGFLPQDYGKNYTVELKDSNGEKIPFGYHNWVVDSGNGLLTFNNGDPDEFTAPYYLSFYRYVGRTGDSLLSSSGANLDENYVPTEPTSIATKGYIDDLYKSINEAVGNLIPEKPATLENQDLTVTAPHYFSAYYIKSNQQYNCIMEGDSITVTTDYFYNELSGTIRVYIGDEDLGIQVPVSKTLAIGPFNSYIEVLDNKDAYEGMSSGFYRVLKLKVTIPYDLYESYFTETSPFISIRLSYNNGTYFSNYATVGIERAVTNGSLTFANLILESDNNKYISGVPSLKEGTTVKFEAITNTLTRFYTDKFIKVKVNNFFEKEILPNVGSYDTSITYEGGEIRYDIGVAFTIPADQYSEYLVIDTTAYDCLGNELYTVTNMFHVRVDTYTKITRRTSGIGDIPDDTALAIYKNAKSLLETNELQQMGTTIIYPNVDYSQNGIRQHDSETGEEPFFHDKVIENSVQGPDYSTLISDPIMRYITYRYDITEYTNAFIVHINTSYIKHDENSHIMENCSLQCKIDGTGWLNCNAAYDGVSLPENDNDQALVIYRSSTTEKYITFGPTPRKGTLYLRFGMKNVNGIVNSIDIEPISLNS